MMCLRSAPLLSQLCFYPGATLCAPTIMFQYAEERLKFWPLCILWCRCCAHGEPLWLLSIASYSSSGSSSGERTAFLLHTFHLMQPMKS